MMSSTSATKKRGDEEVSVTSELALISGMKWESIPRLPSLRASLFVELDSRRLFKSAMILGPHLR